MIRQIALATSLTLATFLAPAAQAEDPQLLQRALALADARDWDGAGAKARAAGTVSADIVEWRRLREGEGRFGDYLAFVTRHPDWPGMPYLREMGEAAITSADSKADVIAYFNGLAPQTGAGSLALARAYSAKGDHQAATNEVVRGWRNLSMDDADHAAFMAEYGPALGEHHDGRVAAMLTAGLLRDAKRMLPLASANTRAVAMARIALQAQADGVDGLVAAVPASMAGSTGLAYDRFRWRIRKNLYVSAGDLMLERSGSAQSLGDPGRWADWRRRLARKEMREGDARRAYQMAAKHHLKTGSDYADLEWLAGYIALRKLGDAETALTHFDRFARSVNGPISLSRASYWRGRAFEALGRGGEAQAAYAEGARYQTAFYGLLSAEKVGLPLSPAMIGGESYPDWRGASFANSSVVAAGRALMAAGDHTLAARFLTHLAEDLSGEDIGRLAGMALEAGEPYVALSLAKDAANKGVIWPSAYFPLIGVEHLKLPVRTELALAIARRESEFNPGVVSHAGARGLMQLMPGTAKMMAKELGLGYDGGKLTTDWSYNARLGAEYLAGLEAEFGSSPLLVATGYNAGPGRSRRWITELGDPRADGVDPVDWIEAIPFRETQTYVMRVAESLPIYRARLSGQTAPLRFWEELKGR
ncbi:MAG: lytic transglycosylase domain-containing protein [Albidovulum sp.]